MRSLQAWKRPFVCALGSAGAGVVLLVALSQRPSQAQAQAVRAEGPTVANVTGVTEVGTPGEQRVEISLGDALGRRWVEAAYRGNGRDELRATLVNRSGRALRVVFPAGLVFESLDLTAQVVLPRDATVDLTATGGAGDNARLTTRLATAATRTRNRLADAPFARSEVTLPLLEPLLAEVRRCPEAARETVATAVLLVTENPPLAAFARFGLLTGDAPAAAGNGSGGRYPECFKVATTDLLAALTLAREAGTPRAALAAAGEPQLRIEAMIDPLSHAAALRFWNLAPEKEWTYWKEELLHGDASTRHYALYGIGRYFPEVALQMLPDWARDQRVNVLFRQSAIQALAETRRPAAISVLQQLVHDLGPNTELGVSARRATMYLENRREDVADAAGVAGLSFRGAGAQVR